MRFGGQEEKRRRVAEGQPYSCAFSKHRVAEAPNNVMDQPTPFSLEQHLNTRGSWELYCPSSGMYGAC